MTADVQRELAQTLYLGVTLPSSGTRWDRAEHIAAALLPTVQRLIADAEKRAAAAALREAANAVRYALPGYVGRIDTADSIEERAAALDPAGAASGETT